MYMDLETKDLLGYYFLLGYKHSFEGVAGGFSLPELPAKIAAGCREAYYKGFSLQGQNKTFDAAILDSFQS